MNLKEEIQKATILQCHTYAVSPTDAERIAESYAKERGKARAWEVWKYFCLELPNKATDELIRTEREFFEQWYNSTPTGADRNRLGEDDNTLNFTGRGKL